MATRELVRELWPVVEKAYRWCLTTETDGDGLIENTSGGLGAIEVGELREGIHQDIYLAAVVGRSPSSHAGTGPFHGYGYDCGRGQEAS